MKQYRHYLWKLALLAVLLLLAPAFAFAQYPFEGIYLGSYEGISDDGEFGLIVDSSGHATLAAYDALDDIGYVEEDIVLNPDGSFAFNTQRGAHIEGQLTSYGVSGSWYAPGAGGGFSGERMPADGPMGEAAGLYSGQVAVTRLGSSLTDYGRMTAVVAADGSAFFLIDQAVSLNGDFVPGSFDFNFDPVTRGGRGHGFGFCPPFFAGRSFSFGVSIGILDFTYKFSTPGCNSYWNWGWGFFGDIWNAHLEAFQYSGGMLQIEPDGLIDGVLLDDLKLQGLLDTQRAKAEGLVLEDEGISAWTGYWKVERRYDTGHIMAATRFTQLPDVDGDGSADILLSQVATGDEPGWLMMSEETAEELVPLLSQSTDYRMVGSADFNADGLLDVLIRDDTTGADIIMTGPAANSDLLSLPGTGTADWVSTAVADFDGDHAPDILLMNRQTQGLRIQLMNGLVPAETIDMPAEYQPAGWQTATIGDIDGDGSNDLLLRNDGTGEEVFWSIRAVGDVTVTQRSRVSDPH